MPTSSNLQGQRVKIPSAVESVFGTPPASGWAGMYFYNFRMTAKQPPEHDPVIGGDLYNFNDSRGSNLGLVTHEGSADVPLCLNGVGYVLQHLFGDPTTTGSTNYQHVFESGADVLPTKSFEQQVAASDFRIHKGVACRGFDMALKDENGNQMLTLDLIGMDEELASSSGAGSFSTPAYDPARKTLALVKIDGTTVGRLVDGKLTYKNGLVAERYVDGSAAVSEISMADENKFTGELRIRYVAGQTYDALAVAEADHTLEIVWSRGANNSLSLYTPAVRLGRPGLEIQGPGGLEQTIPFEAHQTASAAMLKATLKNQIASY